MTVWRVAWRERIGVYVGVVRYSEHGGRCSACGDDFPEGAPIVLTTTSEGFWLHEGCAQ